MKKIAILLTLVMVLAIASVASAADAPKVSGEVVYKMLLGNQEGYSPDQTLKSWETAKIAVSGNINPELSYIVGIKYDMASNSGMQNNWPGSGNANGNSVGKSSSLGLFIDKAALTYKHTGTPVSFVFGKNAAGSNRMAYFSTGYASSSGAEGILVKTDVINGFQAQVLFQPNNGNDDGKYVALKNVWADYKTPVGEFGLNLSRAKYAADGDTEMSYSVEGQVPVPGTPLTILGEYGKNADPSVDETGYIVGVKAAVLKDATLSVEYTDNTATAFLYSPVQNPSASLGSGVSGTAIVFTKPIGGIATTLKYAMFENDSAQLNVELKASF